MVEVYSEVDRFLKRLADKENLTMAEFPSIIRGSVYAILDKYDLIRFRNPRNKDHGMVDITANGLEVVKAGGIKNYIERNEQEEKERRDTEHKVNLSTLEINEVQKRLARENRKFGTINIILGILNLLLLAWQLIKAAK